jgi:hypothetical protein
MEFLKKIFNWLATNIGHASWNPFGKIASTSEAVTDAGLAASDHPAMTAFDYAKLVFAIVAPFGIVLFALHYFGIIKLWGRKSYKRRRSAASRRSAARRPARMRVSGSARSKQLRALAKGRATRARNLRAKRKK